FQVAQQNESPLWQDVISFDNDWLEKQGVYNSENHTVDEPKMRSIVRETMQTMLAAERMQQSAIWTASLHYNTDNIHVHIATVEPHPTREVMNVFDKETNTWREEYRAKRKPKTLEKMKSKVANCILDRANERNDIDELLRGTVRYKKDNQISLASFRKTNELFTEAIKRLPEDRKQWRYGYEFINEARPYIDEITNIYLEQFHAEEMEELVTSLDEEVNVMKEMYGEESNYHTYKETKMDDLKKRMGNAILTEMRSVDKEEKTSLFRQKIAARQLHALEKGDQGTLFQRYHGSSNQQLNVMKEMYGEENNYHNYKETKMDDLKKRMGNAILTEMRSVDKEEKTSLFRQKIAARQLHALEKGDQGTLFQRYHGSSNQQLHVSVIRLKQAMRKTFYDYKYERHMDEFDQMM